MHSVFARVSSDFVSLSTPAFIGGEAVRLAWLKAHGAGLGKAAWVIFLEIYLDVASTALVVYASPPYLLLHREYLLATLAAATSPATTTLFIFVFSRRKAIHIPNLLQKVIRFLLGESRGGRVIESLNKSLHTYHNSASNCCVE